jgi:L-iditol 2-dehydrogenase
LKAWVLHKIGDLRFEEVPIPEIKAGEALLKVKYAGICSSDLPRIFTTGTYHYPLIPGHEFSAVVERVADEENAAWVGKAVGVFPLIPCFECESCKAGRYETCSHYSYIGSRQAGAFAEYVAAPVWNLLELPSGADLAQAAMLEPAAVALHAVRRLDLRDVKSAAVVGNGPIGMIIARWLKIGGVSEVSALGRLDPMSANAVDVAVEAVGTNEALHRCIDMLKPGGQLLLVGNPTADFALGQKDYWQFLRKQLRITGTWNSAFNHSGDDDWQVTLRHIAQGDLDLGGLISHRYGLSELDRALEMMSERREKREKVMVEAVL